MPTLPKPEPIESTKLLAGLPPPAWFVSHRGHFLTTKGRGMDAYRFSMLFESAVAAAAGIALAMLAITAIERVDRDSRR